MLLIHNKLPILGKSLINSIDGVPRKLNNYKNFTDYPKGLMENGIYAKWPKTKKQKK